MQVNLYLVPQMRQILFLLLLFYVSAPFSAAQNQPDQSRAQKLITSLNTDISDAKAVRGKVDDILESDHSFRVTKSFDLLLSAVEELRKRAQYLELRYRNAQRGNSLSPEENRQVALLLDALDKELDDLLKFEQDMRNDVALPYDRISGWKAPVTLGIAVAGACFWDSPQRLGVVTEAGINFNSEDSGTIASSELVRTYFGAVRAAFGTAVSSSTTREDVLTNRRKFLEAGGAARVKLDYPLIYLGPEIECSPDGGRVNSPSSRFYMTLAPRIGFDTPSVGTQIESDSWALDLGVDLNLKLFSASLRGKSDVVALEFALRGARVFGTDSFYSGLNTPEDVANDEAISSGFGYIQGFINVGIFDVFKLAFSIPVSGPDGIKDGMRRSMKASLVGSKLF